jgi:Ser/Thr protein kinase RdoA (MazF antagonist)
VARRDGATLSELAGRPAAVITFLPGLAAAQPKRAQQRAAGEGLAWLHQAAQGFPGRRTNDLGQHAWAFTADGRYEAEAAAALVAGYESRRPLSAEERQTLPLLAWGAALRFFLTRLADWGARRDGALVRPKDPLEYAARLAFHRAEGVRL